ncbi:MAG: hypothetical protein AB1941_12670 [Gemmatimonadota bacterium]
MRTHAPAGRTPVAAQLCPLVLHAEDPEHLRRLRGFLPREQPAALAERWSDVESQPAGPWCLVVAVGSLRTSPLVRRIATLRARQPHRPVVLVTHWDPENTRHLKDVSVEEVVWCREAERDLAAAVRRACGRGSGVLLQAAAELEAAAHLPPALRAALVHACRSEVPVRSVNQLAAAVGSDRRTLWYHWTRTVGPLAELRLQDFLHWVLLLRALATRTSGHTWAAAAGEVGVHAHTLWRFARHLTGRTLPSLGGADADAAALFRERALALFLPPDALDKL